MLDVNVPMTRNKPSNEAVFHSNLLFEEVGTPGLNDTNDREKKRNGCRTESGESFGFLSTVQG
jgi:hypothetical protein